MKGGELVLYFIVRRVVVKLWAFKLVCYFFIVDPSVSVALNCGAPHQKKISVMKDSFHGSPGPITTLEYVVLPLRRYDTW